MFIKVRLLKGFSEPLWYQVPHDWDIHNLVGSVVQVPLRHLFKSAVVLELANQVSMEAQNFIIKFAHARDQLPDDPHYAEFLAQLSFYCQVQPLMFLRRIQQFLTQKEVREVAQATENVAEKPTVTLTQAQQVVADFIVSAMNGATYAPTLLHGVTGSGKTEVYKKIIEHGLEQKKVVLLLLPEVTLALQFEALLKQQLPQYASIILSFHSGTPMREKRALWNLLGAQEPVLIIGVHLPILLPIPHLGVIIVDEEHESGYQEKKHPKVNSKEAALIRARIAQVPILLGSATPSVSSLYNVQKKGWHFFQLKERFGGAMPTIQTVLLNDYKNKDRKHFWFSDQLIMAIKNRLAKKEQIIIFINRRGFSFFMQCKACSFIVSCAACSVSLTLHDTNMLHCHYCGFSTGAPQHCTSCKATDFLKKGIGTQQVVLMLEKIFPTARIGRADMDITSQKKVWQKTVQDFETGQLDILVGTQVITKGFHFPKVTLVGILWADLNLHFPVYNASEVALQQLIQVAGRAGRERAESLVIVQTMSDHPIFNYVNELAYVDYVNRELEMRKLVGYPPCIRLAEIEFKHKDEQTVEQEAQEMAAEIATLIVQKKLPIIVLGPAKPSVSKIKNIHARKIYLKAPDMISLCELYAEAAQKKRRSYFYFTPNPI